MTNAELYKALKNNKYVIVRNWIGIPCGINSQIVLLMTKKKNIKWTPRKHSKIASYRPCTFQEYITNKIGYL